MLPGSARKKAGLEEKWRREREGFVSSRGIEKRQVVGMPISTVLTMSTLFKTSVHKRYTGLHAIKRQTAKTF